jgi:hypothetical protein
VRSLEPDTGGYPQESIEEAIRSLIEYCRRNDWAGYDPYDALNSRLFAATPFHRSRIFRLIFTQGLKRLPMNIRPILKVQKAQNPKAIALFLAAFLKLSRYGCPGSERLIGVMAERLTALRSQGTPYWCWGYSFPWQTRAVIVPRGAPNLVCTVFAADALLDAYERDPKPRYLEMAASAAEYILEELYWTDGDGTASFSYPLPGLRIMTHNANFLGAALLCRIYKHCDEKRFLEPALKVTRCSVARQHDDGAWDYSEASTQRWADNFHTGYNLCALQSIARSAGTSEFEGHIRRGFEFYCNHFFREDGAPKYFHDRTYPIDIHSVAQSIITLLAFRDLDEGNLPLACSVFRWAMRHMWDKRGYFYFRVLPVGKNRISYMRWSQAWMLLALATLLEHCDQKRQNGV